MNTTPSDPNSPHDDNAPAWGSAPSTPPAGSGHEAPGFTGPPSSGYQPPQPGFQPAQPGPSARTTGVQFFDSVRRLGVVRPDDGRMIAGVCAGLARRWGMNPMVVRGLFVLLGLITGLGFALYGVLWLLLPHPDGRIHAQQALQGTVTAGFIGGALAILANSPFGGWGAWHHGPGVLPLILVGLGVWWLMRRRHASRGC